MHTFAAIKTHAAQRRAGSEYVCLRLLPAAQSFQDDCPLWHTFVQLYLSKVLMLRSWHCMLTSTNTLSIVCKVGSPAILWRHSPSPSPPAQGGVAHARGHLDFPSSRRLEAACQSHQCRRANFKKGMAKHWQYKRELPQCQGPHTTDRLRPCSQNPW